MIEKVNVAEKFGRFSEHWKPKIIGELNDSYVKAVKVKGAFVWHDHPSEDELFYVTKGRLRIRLRDGVIDSSPVSSPSFRMGSSIFQSRTLRPMCFCWSRRPRSIRARSGMTAPLPRPSGSSGFQVSEAGAGVAKRRTMRANRSTISVNCPGSGRD